MHGWPGLEKFLARNGLTRTQWDRANREGKLWCCACKSFRAAEDFGISRHAYQRQRQTRCKSCSEEWNRKYKAAWYQEHRDEMRQRQRKWYEKNRTAVRKRSHDWRKALDPEARHSYNVKSRLRDRYGLTLDQFNQMVAEQNGVCAVCKKPPEIGRLCVDHDHATQVNRGLLCRRCNSFLGYIENHRELVPVLISYLEKYK